MVRWSKEPRRISVVEGRAAASLARVFRIVSCFTYNNETTKELSCQALNEHSRVKFQSSTLPKDWCCRIQRHTQVAPHLERVEFPQQSQPGADPPTANSTPREHVNLSS